jgi:hypothetical protein
MKKYFTACFVSVIMLFSLGGMAAGQGGSDGSGQRGLTWSLGYDGSYFSYKETANGGTLDQDTGWMNGLFLEAQYDTKEIFLRGSVDFSGSNSATYKGALQNGTPVTMQTSEFFYQVEGAVGYKALNFSHATLSPYVAIGYRYWDRGEDNPPDYLETYTWGYAALGCNFSYWYGKGLIGLDASIQFLIDPQMQTDAGGLFDTATFNLKPEPGFHIEVPMTYDISRSQLRTVSLFARPYYQRWNIGASDPVLLTQNGSPLLDPSTGQPLYAFEPDSHTDIYGIKFGVSINF